MPGKRPRLHIPGLLILSLCCLLASAFCPVARAQSAGAAAGSKEMEAVLFVQSLPMKNGQQGIHLVWIPQPIQKLCLGKTAQQCADIDYCIRTTNRDVSTCRKLGIPSSQLPSYPRGIIPARQLSITYLALGPNNFASLQKFFHSAPKASLEHLSMSARVKARVRFTRKPDDDDFDVLEIIAVPPF